MINKLKIFINKNRQSLIIISTILLLFVSITNFYFIFNVTAQSNDECLWTNTKDEKNRLIIFSNVKVDGVTWQAGIRDGDYLVAIDGIKINNTLEATRILDKIPYGDYASYTILRNRTTFETNVFIKKFINIGGLSQNLLSLIWLIVAFVVVMSKPEGKIQNLFYRVAVFSVLFSTNSLLFRGIQVDNIILQSHVAISVVATCIILGNIMFPFSLVHFFSVFPKEYSFVSKKWFKIIFYKAGILIFVIHEFIAGYEYLHYGITLLADGIGNVLFFVGYGLFNISFILLVVNYFKLPSKQEKKSIFVILISFLIAVLARTYFTFLAAPFGGLAFNHPEYYTPILLIVLVPIAFGYSIFKYSLMELNDIVKNAIVYGAATISIAGTYYLIIYLIGLGVSSAIGTEYQVMIAGAVFVVFSLVFQSTKDKFQNVLTEKFYPEQFAFQKGLVKFGNEIISVVGKENIFNSIQELFVDSLRIQKFGLLLRNENNSFELVRQKGIENLNLRLEDYDFKIENYCIECNMFGKKQVLERQDFEHILGDSASKLINENLYTVIPLFIKSKIIGLLLFGLKQSGAQFAGKDLDLLIAAANQTAVSIDNARLYESEVEAQKIERDLENARRIQETLLPKVVPKINRLEISGKMIPAMHVGGDYYDLIKISETKLFVVIGDVSGKGLSASFYMSKLQTMIRLYCTAGKSPRQILTEVNKNIYESIERNWFITVTLALIDIKNKTMKFCRAGHTPLILVRNNSIQQIKPAGLGIGLQKGDKFSKSLVERTIRFKRNDLFFFYSDGITEMMNQNDELFGEDRLNKFLLKNAGKNCDEIQTRLLQSLQSFHDKTHQYDDVTSLVIKVI